MDRISRPAVVIYTLGCRVNQYESDAIAEQLETGRQALIITAGRARAERLSSDLSFFCDRNVLTVPADEHIFLGYRARSREDQVGLDCFRPALRGDVKVRHGIDLIAPEFDPDRLPRCW